MNTEAKKNSMTSQGKYRLKTLLDILRHQTVPHPGHSDPSSIKQTWEEIHDLINELPNEYQSSQKKAKHSKGQKTYINKKERTALHDAQEQVLNVIEGCSAEENDPVLRMLNNTHVNILK